MKGEIDKRIPLFEMWTELYPDDLSAYGHLASAYLWWGNRTDDAIATYLKIYEIDPTADWVLRQVASMLIGTEQYEEAIAHYRRYSQLHPEEHSPFINIGEVYERMGELEKAREQYEKANLLSSGVVYPLLCLARIDSKEGQVDEGIERLLETETIAVTPEAEALVVESWIDLLRLRGQIGKAVELVPRFAELESQYRMQLDVMIEGIFLIDLYVLAGRQEEAIARLESYRESIEPPFDAFLDFGFMLGYMAAEDPDQAEVYRDKALILVDEFGRKDLSSIAELGTARIHELRGEYPAAVAAYRRALQLFIESAQNAWGGEQEIGLLTALGRAQRLAGELEAAEESLTEVLRLFPSHPEAHLELARLYDASGNPEAAHSHLEAALEMWRDADPNYPPAQAARSFYAGQPVG